MEVKLSASDKEKLHSISVNASDISIHDEWMEEDEWDDIYKSLMLTK